MDTFSLISAVLCLAAFFGFVSHRVLRLPTTVGTMILALLLSAALLCLRVFSHGAASAMGVAASAVVDRIDFGQVVLHGMLAFLLFAATLGLDLGALLRERVPVAALAVVSTLISTGIVAGLVYLVLPRLGITVQPLFCLLFGALIAPTDPVAVLGMLRRVGAPAAIETRLAGESLFNDAVGAVIFLSLLQAGASGSQPTAARLLLLLSRQAGGGVAIGLALGYITYRMLKVVDDFRVEITLTLALATGSYALADALRLSAPLAVIAAGLVVNGRATRFAMSQPTREHLQSFWELVDEILNVVLFLLLGLELLALALQRNFLLAGLLAIPIVLLARYVSVAAVFGGLQFRRPHVRGSLRILTWAGLRGGLSVALALGLPAGPQRALALTMTYVVVVFSILVQGLTVGALIRRLQPRGS